MELLEWLAGSDTETYSSAKPPDFLGVQKPKPLSLSPQSKGSPVRSTGVRPGSTETVTTGFQPQHSLTPLESRIKNLILNVYSHKWIGEEEEEEEGGGTNSQGLQQPTPDEQHKHLHSLPSVTDSQEGFKLNLYASQEDLSVEILSDEEESQTLGLGRLVSSPSSALRVSPIGSESLKLDLTSTELPAHIRRPDLPGQRVGGGAPKLPIELDLSEEQEYISRSTPEGISDSDTDFTPSLSSSASSLARQQLPSLREKERTTFKDQSGSKMSDVHSLASTGSFTEEGVTSVPFFSADDRTINPFDSEVPQVVPSMHQDEVPYASFYASARDSGAPNIPSALRPSSSSVAPYGTDDPSSNFGLLYSFSDSSYKARLSKSSSKPRSQVTDSFGMSQDVYQFSHPKPTRSVPPTTHTKKAASVGGESSEVFHKPRFVSESDGYPADNKEEEAVTKADTVSSGGGGREDEGEGEEEDERSSLTPVFDANDEDASKEATPIPELALTSNRESTSLSSDGASEYSQPGSRDHVYVATLGEDREDKTESPQDQPQQPGIGCVDSSGNLEFKSTSPAGYSEAPPIVEEAVKDPLCSKASEEHRERKTNNVQPSSLDPPSYRVSTLDSDIETSSVVSVQELTETLLSEHGRQPLESHSDHAHTNPTGKIPFSLPLVHPHTQVGATSTTPSDMSLPSRRTPTPGVAKPWTPSKHTPPPLVSSKLPQHLQLSPKFPPKRSSPLPTGHTRESSLSSEISEGSSLLVQPIKNVTQTPETEVKRPESIKEQPTEPVKETLDETAQKELQSLKEELTQVLRDKANLEGQLESVTEECKVTMRDRADLQSKLARAEAELVEMAETLERERSRSTDSRPKVTQVHVSTSAQDVDEVKEELVKTKDELEREKETVASLKSEVAREKQSARKLQSNLEWTNQSLKEQQSSVADLQERLKALQSMVDQKSSELEEADAKLSSLEASYGALQGTKDWLHGQLENALEEKRKLQEEWRESKANAVAQSMKAEQLLKENATFQQQISDLQQGILQDKAKLVNELEAIEADVLSREDSYSHLVAEKAQLEDMVKMKGDTLERLNSDLARARVEKEELEKKMEDCDMQNDVLTSKVEDLERQREALAEKLKLAGQELEAKNSDMREMEKARSSLQERLKQSDAALISKDGTCQGLVDANEILKHELEMVTQDRDKVEKELDKTKEEVAALEADLKLANNSNRGKDTEVKSLAQLRQVSTAESQALKEKLAEKERELEEKTSELESLEAQSGELLGQFKMLQDQFQSIAADSGSVQESMAEKDRVIAHLSSVKDETEQELASLKEENEHIKNKLTQLEHNNARLEGEVEVSSSANLEEFQKAVQDKAQLQAELNSLKLGQQHESIRAQAKANRLEVDLRAVKKEMERTQRELEKALQQKEEELGKLEEEKLHLESGVLDLKSKLERAQREKERLQTNVEMKKPASSTLEALTARCEQLAQQNQALGERLQQEASQRTEIERASGMVATKLKQNAQEEEKKLQHQIRDLSLEIERLRGRLNGMATTQAAMRDHATSLEAALAKRESSLVKLSAQAQKVLEEKELEDQAFAAQVASLEKQIEVSARENETWKTKAQAERKRAEELGQLLSQKEMELVNVKALLEQTSQSGRSVPYLEEKIAELAVEKDNLLSQISGLKTQLTVASAAVDIAKKDLTDRSSQVDILKKELDMAKSQRAQTESEVRQLQDQLKTNESRHQVEVGKLKGALLKERESSVMEDRDPESKSGLFEMSLSTIATDDVDKAHSGT